MLKPENKFYQRVKRDMDTLPNTFWWKTQEVGRRGIPDIVSCVAGVFIAIELKADKGKLSALQKHTLDKIQMAGGQAVVCYPEDWPVLLGQLRQIANQNDLLMRDWKPLC